MYTLSRFRRVGDRDKAMKMNKSLVTRFVFAAILAVAVAATGCGSDDNGGAGSGGDGGDGGGGGTGGTVAGPTIEMTAPSGGDPVQPGSVVTIEWTADSDVTGVDLSYTTDAAGTVSDPVMIEMDVVGSSYAWTTPTGPLFGVKIKGVATNAAGDTTDASRGGCSNSARSPVIRTAPRSQAKRSQRC